MLKVSLFVFLTAVFFVSCEEVDNSNLKAVAVTFRHGERNIFHKLKDDPYADEKYWVEGFGELRIKGKQHHYELGQWFRRHYRGFLPELYSPEDLKVQSTDVDRTLMSVSSHLAGLFPPQGYQEWNPQLKWQPIPIHTRPLDEDAVVGTFKSCDKYDRLYEKVEKELLKKHAENITDYLYEHTGENITKLMQLIEIHDTLFVEQNDFNFQLPEWTKDVYPEPLDSLSALAFKSFTINKDIARLRMGPFLHEIVSNFENVTHGNRHYKYNIYSAHDLNVANILTTFGAYNDIRPPYASAVAIELREHKTKAGEYYINVLYKNSTVEEPPVKVNVSGCDFDCDFTKFKELLKDVIINLDTRNAECEDKEFKASFEGMFLAPKQPRGRSALSFIT